MDEVILAIPVDRAGTVIAIRNRHGNVLGTIAANEEDREERALLYDLLEISLDVEIGAIQERQSRSSNNILRLDDLDGGVTELFNYSCNLIGIG
jgi:hypothetical protein